MGNIIFVCLREVFKFVLSICLVEYLIILDISRYIDIKYCNISFDIILEAIYILLSYNSVFGDNLFTSVIKAKKKTKPKLTLRKQRVPMVFIYSMPRSIMETGPQV